MSDKPDAGLILLLTGMFAFVGYAVAQHTSALDGAAFSVLCILVLSAIKGRE